MRSVCELLDDEDPGQQFDKRLLLKDKKYENVKEKKQQTTLFFPTVKQPIDDVMNAHS